MKTPRVLHVITAINRGGAENHLFDLVQHQRRAGMRVTVAYLRGSYRDLGVPAHDLRLRYYGDLKPILKLRRLMLATAPDLVHAHMPPAELYARLALTGISARRLPLVITKHNEERFYRGPGQKFMGRWVARRACAVIAISEAVKRYMIGPALSLNPSLLHTIPYGIDARPFAAAAPEAGRALRRRWGVPNESLLIGFVGRLVPQKSVDTLLRGLALLRQRGGADPWLAIVGGGPLEADLRRQARELGVAERVVWAGFHDDIPPVMRAFDVFSMTSVYEGFGLVLVEAMAADLPVVATRAGSIPEIVVHGETGMLIEPRDHAALAAAWGRFEDTELRARFGAAGQRRVFETFTLDRMFHETDKLYARILPAASVRACAAETVAPECLTSFAL
ncbi:MAG: glycosyltransferase [Gemmataceae bacterium]